MRKKHNDNSYGSFGDWGSFGDSGQGGWGNDSSQDFSSGSSGYASSGKGGFGGRSSYTPSGRGSFGDSGWDSDDDEDYYSPSHRSSAPFVTSTPALQYASSSSSGYRPRRKVLSWPWLFLLLAALGLFFALRSRNAPAAAPAGYIGSSPTHLTAAQYTTPYEQQRYFRRMLEGNDAVLYDQLRLGAANHLDCIERLSCADSEDLHKVFDYLYYDYAEYFWLDGSWSSSTDTAARLSSLSPGYRFDAQSSAAYADYIERCTAQEISRLQGSGEYDKVKAVYEYLINNTIYDLDYTGTTIYELFSENRAVCEGYARATQYMLTKLGVEAIYVTGDTIEDPGPHAWNIVRVNGKYYQVDTTWGDPVSEDGTQSLNYNYLCITDDEMLRSRVYDESLYPVCSSSDLNYYRLNDRFISGYDRDIICSWLNEAYTSGEEIAYLAANEAVYSEILSRLFGDSGEVWDLMNSMYSNINRSAVYNSADPNTYVIRIWFE